jgi:uncharacterized DUF497 family protein
MRFEWNDEKDRQNLLKHGVRFETAALVFDDPCALTQHDDSARGDHENHFGSRRDAAGEEKL